MKDIINTSETEILIILAQITILFMIIYSSIYGFLLFFFTFSGGWTDFNIFFPLPMIILLFIPIFIIIHTYFNIFEYYKNKFSLKPLNSKEIFDHKILKLIENITHKLGLKETPRLWYSKYKNIKPFIFCEKINKSHLILPLNYREIFSDLPISNKDIKKDLHSFLLSHELSHIRNKDHYFMSFSAIIIQSIIIWLICLIILQIFYDFFPKYSFSIFIFNAPFLATMTALTLLFYKIFLSISKKREYLADARSSTFISPEKLKRLSNKSIKIGENDYSPIELLFKALKSFSKYSNRNDNILKYLYNKYLSIYVENILKALRWFFCNIKIGYILNVIKFRRLRRFLLETHPLDNLRNEAIYTRSFLNANNPLPTKETSIYIGIINAIIYYLFSITYISLLLYNRSSPSLKFLLLTTGVHP